MITRYSRPEMQAVWNNENKFKNWLEIELLACEAQESIGEFPKGVAKKIRSKAKFDTKQIEQLANEIKHDVHAFLVNVAEHVGDESKYLHLGPTSFDIQDTGFAMQLRQAADIIIDDLNLLLKTLVVKIEEHKTTLCVGRSHGVHSEPTTFGLKLVNHYSAFLRARDRMLLAKEEISVCTIAGAVGTYATVDPRIESYVAKNIGIKHNDLSSEIISRDRHAMFFATLAVTAASIENFATEMRHLQRTEVQEVEEFFDVWNKISSALPHKHNPIASENLIGFSRLIRAAVMPALENVTLWHERDITHYSIEQITAPDTLMLLDFSLNGLISIIEKMIVHHENMIKNLEMSHGLVFSQHVILELVKGGMSRDYAYKMVQQLCVKVLENEGTNFLDVVLGDETVAEYVSKEKLRNIFDYSNCIRRSTDVINKVLGKDKDRDA